MLDSISRFDNRVASYRRGRPSYPYAVLACLCEVYHLRPVACVADVGAGTGLLTRLLLTAGCTVYAVEPNAQMRHMAATQLGGHPGYRSSAGSAEATRLPAHSVDFVTAGQAFHWFQQDAAREEFRRILRPGGWVALVWNERRERGTPLLEGYQALVERFGEQIAQVDHAHVVDASTLARFFGAGGYATYTFEQRQPLSHSGLSDRLTSTSYMPGPDHAAYGALRQAIDALFVSTAVRGCVEMIYDTRLYVGRV